MLCIEIWSLDSTEHIQVNATWVSPMLIWTEEGSTRIEVSVELFLGIEVTCRNVSEGIEIWSEFTPKIEVWTSYVCSLYDGDLPAPYLFIIPDFIEYKANETDTRISKVFSNRYWIITKIK